MEMVIHLNNEHSRIPWSEDGFFLKCRCELWCA